MTQSESTEKTLLTGVLRLSFSFVLDPSSDRGPEELGGANCGMEADAVSS